MQINVTARHMDLTPAMRERAVAKVTAALDGVPRVTNVHVILAVEKHRQQAEVVLQVLHHTIEAKDEKDDLYAAIDGMADKLVRQVEKLRDKGTDHKKPGHAPSA